MRFATMTNWRWHIVVAAIAGLGLRLYFILHFPSNSGDTPIYEGLATNWLNHGIYGITAENTTPTDLRVPGYPAFLAGIYALTGRTGAAARLYVMLAQAFADLGTCFITAAIARGLAPATLRARMRIVALWLAATCPFLANYTAVPLTETLTTFFSALALLLFIASVKGFSATDEFDEAYPKFVGKNSFILGAFSAGIATLLRPESPLLLIAFWMLLAWEMCHRARHNARWRHLALTAAAVGVFFLLPLLPWAARNAVSLHKLQLVAPRYAQLPSEIVPIGFYAWEKTWLTRMRDVYLVSWKLDEEEIRMQDIPSSAFDSSAERERVSALLAKHNQAYVMTQEIDDGFAKLAAERTARHPLRTYLEVPLGRILTIWFTPRIELLPYSGHLRPVVSSWQDDPRDFSVTIGFFALNVIYVALAIAGAWRAWQAPGNEPSYVHRAIALIALFIVIRTLFLATIESPEPRYVLECFPAVLALGAFSFLPRVQDGL